LCLASRELDPQTYEVWNKKYQEASIALVDRDKLVFFSCLFFCILFCPLRTISRSTSNDSISPDGPSRRRD
jgi:hypothetical protein